MKKIVDYTLDCYDEYAILGHGGTSRSAIEYFVNWINKTKDFNIECEYLEKKEVTYDKVYNCIKNNGVCYIRSWLKDEHYILITKINKKYAYIFDPYYLNKLKYKDKFVKIILNKPFKYNRRVSIKRVFSETEKDFSLGKINKRQCVLIKKCK